MIGDFTVIGYGREICRRDKAPTHLISYSHMIHFVESGHGFFAGRRLGPGDGFICRQNKMCHYYPDPEDPWTYTWINVMEKGSDELLAQLPLRENVFCFPPDKDLPILHEINCGKKGAAGTMKAMGVLLRVFADVLDHEGVTEDYVTAAKHLMKGRFERGVTVQEIADQLGISRAYLRNLFYESEQCSPQEYLMRLRMERAEFLLHQPFSVTEVAGAVGYQDVLQFSRIFVKYHGVSPTEYRRREQK